MSRFIPLFVAAISALVPSWGQAKDGPERVWEALINCKSHFNKQGELERAFIADGWTHENDSGTPIVIFTANDQSVIASFTRTGAPIAGCTAAAKGMSSSATAALADQFARKSSDLKAHPNEKLAWVWTTAPKSTWFGVTERKKNFSIFRAYAIAFMER